MKQKNYLNSCSSDFLLNFNGQFPSLTSIAAQNYLIIKILMLKAV